MPGGTSSDPEKRGRSLANLRNAPAAPAGNQRALRHGGFAAVASSRLEESARLIFDQLAVDAPLRDEAGGLPAADHLVVSLLAQCLVRLEGVTAYLTLHGLLDPKGKPRPAVEIEGGLRREAASYARDLGLTPRARASLGLELARGASAQQDLEDHLSKHYGEGDVIDGEEAT